jgi:hypothetical protein
MVFALIAQLGSDVKKRICHHYNASMVNIHPQAQ